MTLVLSRHSGNAGREGRHLAEGLHGPDRVPAGTHGFTFVSPAEILAASEGKGDFPEKAVLLTFDDSYESFYRSSYPALQLYNIPRGALRRSLLDRVPRHHGVQGQTVHELAADPGGLRLGPRHGRIAQRPAPPDAAGKPRRERRAGAGGLPLSSRKAGATRRSPSFAPASARTWPRASTC